VADGSAGRVHPGRGWVGLASSIHGNRFSSGAHPRSVHSGLAVSLVRLASEGAKVAKI